MAEELRFLIDRSTGLPPFLQIVEQVTGALQAGNLVIGDYLPAVSSVVSDSVVNANTVLKAYRELSHRGIVEARQGIGTIVINVPSSDGSDNVRKFRENVTMLLEKSRALGLEWDTLRTAMSTVLQNLMIKEQDDVSNRI